MDGRCLYHDSSAGISILCLVPRDYIKSGSYFTGQWYILLAGAPLMIQIRSVQVSMEPPKIHLNGES